MIQAKLSTLPEGTEFAWGTGEPMRVVEQTPEKTLCSPLTSQTRVFSFAGYFVVRVTRWPTDTEPAPAPAQEAKACAGCGVQLSDSGPEHPVDGRYRRICWRCDEDTWVTGGDSAVANRIRARDAATVPPTCAACSSPATDGQHCVYCAKRALDSFTMQIPQDGTCLDTRIAEAQQEQPEPPRHAWDSEVATPGWEG